MTPISHVGGDTSTASPEDYSGSYITHFKFLEPSLGHISSSLILCNTDLGEQMMKELHDDDQLVSHPQKSEPLENKLVYLNLQFKSLLEKCPLLRFIRLFCPFMIY